MSETQAGKSGVAGDAAPLSVQADGSTPGRLPACWSAGDIVSEIARNERVWMVHDPEARMDNETDHNLSLRASQS